MEISKDQIEKLKRMNFKLQEVDVLKRRAIKCGEGSAAHKTYIRVCKHYNFKPHKLF